MCVVIISIRAERSEARFTEPERSEGSAFFTHVFAASGARSERSERGHPSGKKMACTERSREAE